MVYLFLSLASSVAIFIFFKYFHLRNVPLLKAVTINYLACTVTGLFYHFSFLKLNNYESDLSWMPYAMVLGSTFFFTFFLMGKVTAKNGVSIASMATKLSLVFPTLLSIIILGTVKINAYLIFALIISIPSIILASIKKDKKDMFNLAFFLPISIFILGGLIDSSITFLNFKYSKEPSFILFPIIVFLFAAIFGIGFHLVKKSNGNEWKNKKIWLGGTGLGIVNFFSIEFLLQGLVYFENNGAMVFPFLNVGIIIGSSILGVLIFKEPLSRANSLGLSLAIVCLVLLILSSQV